MIRGGDWPSTVAGECLTHFRLALYPGRARRRPQGARRGDGRRRRPRALGGASASRCSTTASPCEGYELAPDAAARHRPARRLRARDRAPAAAVRVDGDDRRAQLPALRRHAGRLLRPARRARARRRRARPPAVDHRDRAGDRALHRRLVRPGGLMLDGPPLRLPDPCLVVLVGATGAGQVALGARVVRRRPGRLVGPPARGRRRRRARPAREPRRVRGARPDRRQAAARAG